jgi:hypothetical protein
MLQFITLAAGKSNIKIQNLYTSQISPLQIVTVLVALVAEIDKRHNLEAK